MKRPGYASVCTTESRLQDILVLRCMCSVTYRSVFVYVLYVLSAGLAYFMCLWRPKLLAYLKYSESASKDADAVLVQGIEGTVQIVEVEKVELETGNNSETHIFRFQHQTYQYLTSEDEFCLVHFEVDCSGKELHENLARGLSSDSAQRRMSLYGPCEMSVPIASIRSILLFEATSPFFLFQLFSIALWIYEDYVLYSLVILLTLLISVFVTVIETQSSMRKIKDAASYSTEVLALRDGRLVNITSEYVVPGDVLQLRNDWKLPCDVVLLQGNCVVNEGLLTGESVPVCKTRLPPSEKVHYNSHSSKLHTLYSGTSILQIDSPAQGLVIATGFCTAQGELLRSLLFPKPSRFQFDQDSIKFVAIFGAIALLGSLFCIRSFIIEKVAPESIVLTVLDLITIVVPPALPIAMSLGANLAAGRLMKEGVMCARVHAINASGRVTAVCFDKTGTLTGDSMEFVGALINKEGRFRSVAIDMSEESAKEMRRCIATCHSITSLQGTISGDPQELAIQQSLGFTLFDETGIREVVDQEEHLRVLQIYHFNPQLKRMAVVTQDSGTGTILYVKGAPELIAARCTSLPRDYDSTIHAYEVQGFRLLACAFRPISVFDSAQQLGDIDQDLTFLGLIVFHNPLNPGVGSLIETLQKAGIQITISTGDSLITGVAVARESCLTPLDEDTYLADVRLSDNEIVWDKQSGVTVVSLGTGMEWTERLRKESGSGFNVAISGAALQRICEDSRISLSPDYEFVFSRLRVCGRMSPGHKTLLVEELQKRGHIVAMCGDGANDCGALKSSDVSVSVGSSGSSIAAGFNGTSVTQVTTVLKEGRAALASSFQCFKFIALYSLIQFTSVNVLYVLETCLLDFQFLYVDLFTIIPLAFAMSKAKAYDGLTRRKPPGSLLAGSVLTSIIGVATIQLLFIVLTAVLVLYERFPRDLETSIDFPTAGAENSAVFLLSNFQYAIVCIAFSSGRPFREAAYKDWMYVSILAICIASDGYFLMCPGKLARRVLEVRFT